ncbi:MAG: ABC transporter substrate-binding protein, partial [Candidatus Thorarchaeota archaeon]
MSWVRKSGVSFILLLLIGSAFTPTTNALVGWEGHSKTGPFVDAIEFKVLEDGLDGYWQIYDDELDITSEDIPIECLDTLIAEEKVWEISTETKNGYGYFTMNCDKYPLNITAFRRAFALALNKEGICDGVWDGLAIPLDCAVPSNNPYSAEEFLPESYHESKIDQAKQLLDAAGFLDTTNDGFREAPNGQGLNISIGIPYGYTITDEIAEFAEEALESIGIAAYVEFEDFYTYNYNPCYCHQLNDYDIRFDSKTFSNFDVDWLGYEYWSEF